MATNDSKNTSKQGKLYLVATPIGNLEDITFRAVKILKEADIIAAEDTRKSGILLARYDIRTPMTSYHKFNEKQRAKFLSRMINHGKDVAVISDAGTPSISDPAHEIVKKCIEFGFEVISVPGPSAAISALAASGLKSTSFSFYGFLPKSEKKRTELVKKLKTREETSIFYESPHRILDSLQTVKKVLGNRKVVVAKEITKIYEEFFRGTVDDVMEMLNAENLKGEFVILLSGSEKSDKLDEISIRELLQEKLEQGKTKKSAVEEISERYSLRKNRVYKISLEI